MIIILCWVGMIPNSSHSNGLLSMDNSTNGLLVEAKVFRTNGSV